MWDTHILLDRVISRPGKSGSVTVANSVAEVHFSLSPSELNTFLLIHHFIHEVLVDFNLRIKLIGIHIIQYTTYELS